MDKTLTKNDNILSNYYNKINELIIKAKQNVRKNINYEMVDLYFNIGKTINELIGKTINELIEKYNLEASQNEIIKAFYNKLTKEFGSGYSIPN